MMHLCLVILFCLASSLHAEIRPRIFSVLLETGETAPDGITNDAYRHRAKLSGCGYDVVGIEPRTLGALEHELRHRAPLEPNETFLVDGHGHLEAGALILSGRSGAERARLPARDFLATIARYSERASVHLDVCYAGAVLPLPENASGLGLSLPADHQHTSASRNPSSELMIDLLCSSNPEQGDCTLWRRVDRDGDGKIAEGEFRRYLRDVSRSVDLQDLYAKPFSPGEHEGIRDFRRQCERDGGSAREADRPVLVQVEYTDDRGPHKVGVSEFRALFPREFHISSDWREALWKEQDYYRSYLEELNRGRFRNVRFSVAGTLYRCQRTEGTLSYQNPGSVDTGRPATIQFLNTVLQSSRCAGGAPPRGSSGRSGLAGLEARREHGDDI